MAIVLGKNILPTKNNSKEQEYKNWLILYWDEMDKKQKIYVKQFDLNGVMNFCKLKGLSKYSIFDENKKNVCNDGVRVKL